MNFKKIFNRVGGGGFLPPYPSIKAPSLHVFLIMTKNSCKYSDVQTMETDLQLNHRPLQA